MANLIVITGQTATGKTEKALEYAAKNNGELVNIDSRQIYKYLDIISGKDLTSKNFTEESKMKDYSLGYYTYETSPYQKISLPSVKLWLYDIVSPHQAFSSFEYVECALAVINLLLKQNKTPILVGGTYFYLQHLLYDRVTNLVPPNMDLREELNTYTVLDLQKKLKSLNNSLYESLNESDRLNPYRLIRKIEISSGESNFVQKDYSFIYSLSNKLSENVIIEYSGYKYKDKDKEMQLINSRIERRMKEGAVEEVEQLLKLGLSEKDPGMNTIGYQQMMKYLKGEYTKEHMLEIWINKEVQYAKRQFTFMKKDPNIKWIEV